MGERIDIDVGAASDPFGVIPEGNYDLQIVHAEKTTSKSSGNPMISFQYEVVGGDYAGRKLFDHAVLNNQFGQWTLKQLLYNAGEPFAGFDIDNLLNTEFEAEVTVTESTDDDTGKTREQNRVTPLIDPDA